MRSRQQRVALAAIALLTALAAADALDVPASNRLVGRDGIAYTLHPRGQPEPSYLDAIATCQKQNGQLASDATIMQHKPLTYFCKKYGVCWVSGVPEDGRCPFFRNGTVNYYNCEANLAFVCESRDVPPTAAQRRRLLASSMALPSGSGAQQRRQLLQAVGKRTKVKAAGGAFYTYFPDRVEHRAALKACEALGAELSPLTSDADTATIEALCKRKRCWVNAITRKGRCTSHSAVKSKASACDLALPYVCKSTTRLKERLAGSPPPPSPPPASGPQPGPTMIGKDGHAYALWAPATHREGLEFCASLSSSARTSMSPFSKWAQRLAVAKLCARADTPCWVHEDTVEGLCPELQQDGSTIVRVDCQQRNAFVCRSELPQAAP